MSLEFDLDSLIQLGHDITSIKYYSLATYTILFYDYLLTLADEIKYVWFGAKSWTFWLFVANRYFPVTYQAWILTRWYASPNSKVCENTVWFPLFAITVCTLLVQVVLTLRIYAVTMKSIPIIVCFGIITTIQLVLGVVSVIFVAREGAIQFPEIPFDSYRICVFIRHRHLEIAYTSISLLYEFLTFSLIIFLAKRSQKRGLEIPRILGTIMDDATWYFLVIFTSHFVLIITLLFGREAIQLLPASGTAAYLPVMISRMILSLRKAVDPQQGDHSLERTANKTNLSEIMFFRPRSGTNGRESDIPLNIYPRS